MARLISVRDFKPDRSLDPSFCFADESRDWRLLDTGLFKIENGLRLALFIHDDNIIDNLPTNDHGDFRAELRCFVEQCLSSDVQLTKIDMSYCYRQGFSTEMDEFDRYPALQEVRHGYHCLSFANESDLVLMKLRFSERFADLSPRHPDYAWVPEQSVSGARYTVPAW